MSSSDTTLGDMEDRIRHKIYTKVGAQILGWLQVLFMLLAVISLDIFGTHWFTLILSGLCAITSYTWFFGEFSGPAWRKRIRSSNKYFAKRNEIDCKKKQLKNRREARVRNG